MNLIPGLGLRTNDHPMGGHSYRMKENGNAKNQEHEIKFVFLAVQEGLYLLLCSAMINKVCQLIQN